MRTLCVGVLQGGRLSSGRYSRVINITAQWLHNSDNLQENPPVETVQTSVIYVALTVKSNQKNYNFVQTVQTCLT